MASGLQDQEAVKAVRTEAEAGMLVAAAAVGDWWWLWMCSVEAWAFSLAGEFLLQRVGCFQRQRRRERRRASRLRRLMRLA